MSLTTGESFEHTYVVTEEMTAKNLLERDGITSYSLPPVWSTPDLIGKMEEAAAALVAPRLDSGQMTVGAHNDVAHLAPTAVAAYDEVEQVGKGTHVRYVVDAARFLARLADKARQG